MDVSKSVTTDRDQRIAQNVRSALRVAQSIFCPWYMDRSDMEGRALLALVEAVDTYEAEAPAHVSLDAWIGRRVRWAVMRERTMHRRWREGEYVAMHGVDFQGRVWRHPAWRARQKNKKCAPAVPRKFDSELMRKVWAENPDFSSEQVAKVIGCAASLVRIRDKREGIRPTKAA